MNIGPILRAMKHNRTRVVLIVLEIAITLAIVTNCVNVILAEREKMAQQSGMDDDNLLSLRVRPFAPEFQQMSFLDTAIDADVRAIAAIPGVRAVANTSLSLWEGGGSSSTFVPVGGRDTQRVQFQTYYSTKDLVDAVGAKLIAGRAFRDGDHGVGTEPDPLNVAIISKAAADLLFPGQPAVGKSFQRAINPGDPPSTPITVIGVIEEFYNPWGMPGSDDPLAEKVVFIPARVGSYGRGIPFFIRTEPGAMRSVAEQVEKKLAEVHPGRVFEFLSMNDKKNRWFSGSKIIVTTMSCIIVVLVAVTALGLLGLTSLSVTERTRQIGTRRALGATRADILRHFLLENWLVTTAGLVLGVFGAYALNFLLVSHVSDLKLEWQIVAAGVVLLWVNGLLSTIPPALRASMVSPSIATRSV